MATRVVIADDDVITRLDIREALEYQGYEVVGEAADGIDAVELCQNLNPDAVLLDVKMPVMDGLTAARLINSDQKNIAIVMLTAYNDKQFVDKAATNFTVVKNGQLTDANTQIEAISGATITSRAVTGGVNAAVTYFENVLKGGN